MAAGSLPLADAPALWPFARRTRLVRLGLGLALLGLFAAAVYSAFQLHTRATSYFASGGRGILVIDLSASVDPRANQRLRTLMRTLANSDQRLGLVAFEEQTYELFPPGTRGDEIRPMLRFFGTSSPEDRKETPWSISFLGGTNIGLALRLARQVAARTGAASVLLVSHLQGSTSDLPLLADQIGQLRARGLGLRVRARVPARASRGAVRPPTQTSRSRRSPPTSASGAPTPGYPRELRSGSWVPATTSSSAKRCSTSRSSAVTNSGDCSSPTAATAIRPRSRTARSSWPHSSSRSRRSPTALEDPN